MRWRRLNSMFRIFFTTEAMGPFLIGAVFLGIVSNAFFQLFTTWLGGNTGSLLGIAGGSIVFLCIAAAFVSREWRRLPPVDPEILDRIPEPHLGLIFLVGKREVFREAIKPHESTIKHLWLLCSQKTLGLANELAEEERRQGIRKVDVHVINDVNDPLEYYRMIQAIYARLPDGWTVSDVIADYVGMTAHASVGTVLACLNAQSRLQFTRAEYDEQLRPIRSLPPFEVIIRLARAGTPPAGTPSLPRTR